VATGPKLFVDQIEADIGPSYGVSHSSSNQRVGHSRLEGQCPTLAIGR